MLGLKGGRGDFIVEIEMTFLFYVAVGKRYFAALTPVAITSI
jgi:hypothetical protein